MKFINYARGNGAQDTGQLKTRKIDANVIPLHMRGKQQWVVWKYEHRNAQSPEGSNNKKTKVPYNARAIKSKGFDLNQSGLKARSSRPETWCNFDEALEVFEGCNGLAGLGYCFTKDDDIAGIDLDNCFDEYNRLLPWAQEIVNDCEGTYMERSPSGKGIHIICRGKVAATGSKTVAERDGIKQAVEVYDSGRYFTVTANQFRSKS